MRALRKLTMSRPNRSCSKCGFEGPDEDFSVTKKWGRGLWPKYIYRCKDRDQCVIRETQKKYRR